MPKPPRTGQVAKCDLVYAHALDKTIKRLGKYACEHVDSIGGARRDLSIALRDVETCYKEVTPRAVAPTQPTPPPPAPAPTWWFPGTIEF